MSFTHLHTHSYHSFGAGTIPTMDLPAIAHKQGMSALALTDTNNMTGAIEFYRAAKKAGIKPILGVEIKTRRERAVLLAKNATGYHEICQTLTRVLEAIPQTKPKFTLEDNEAASPVQTSSPASRIRKRAEEELPAESAAVTLSQFLKAASDNIVILTSSPSILTALAGQPGIHNLFMELIPAERNTWRELRGLYRENPIPVVATNNVMMYRPEGYLLHTVLRAIGTNTTITNTPAFELADPSQFFTTEAELRQMLGNVAEEAFRNVDRIAEMCDVSLDFDSVKWTKFPVEDPDAHLRHLALEGFQRKYARPSSEHLSRFEYELKVIRDLDSASYYLSVHDMIEYAKSRNFPYLGRGSGANSLIAYCLNISNVDPIANNLRFERFLNPERKSPPDFDIDFSWKDRYEVIHYMIDKYGQEKSAMLCTIQCYRDRGTIREVGKALGYPDSEINQEISGNRSARYNYGRTPKHSDRPRQSLPDKEQWMHYANALHGYPRHLSVHAGGLLIADKAITHYTPIQQAPIGVPITQQDMFAAEDWKLIKLDILATRGLGTYWDTMRIVEERTGVRPPVEDERIAFNDERTKDLIRNGRTKGCFYIESPAMISLIKKLRTDNFANLTAASSVIRPGVAQSGMMQEFIKRHRDPSSVTHIHPLLGELMKETYGVMVYQEDVLTVAHEFAGLSYGEADLFRRAMSGKLRSHERMSQQHDNFIKGCLSKGVTPEIAEEVWRQLSSFSGYSFCKAHSASYAVLSFQEAWLKVYYPAEFMCSVLNNFGGFYNHQVYIDEAKHLGVKVLLPDVNRSKHEHTVEGKMAIRLGFVGFKDITSNSITSLLENREKGGFYTSMEDFSMRSGVTMEDGLRLIQLGVCDSIADSRPTAAIHFELRRKSLGFGSKKRSVAQHGIAFPKEDLPYDLSHIREPDRLTIFRREKRFLGYSVSDTPNAFLVAAKTGAVLAADVTRHVGRRIKITGYISATKVVRTRKGDLMMMLNVSDEAGMIDVVVWPEEFRKYHHILSNAQAVIVRGKVSLSFDVATVEAAEIEGVGFEIEEKSAERQAA